MSLGSSLSSLRSMGGGESEDENVWDESVLGDMHLNSAINLDWFFHHYSINTPKYNILKSPPTTRELYMADNLRPGSYMIEIGFQKLFAIFFDCSGLMRKLETGISRVILDIMMRALSKRNMCSPITKIELTDVEGTAHASDELMSWFTEILHAVYARSEWIRSGQSELLYRYVQAGEFIVKNITVRDITVKFILGRHVIEIRNPTNKVSYIGDYSSLLLLLDVAGQRICAQLCSCLGKRIGVPGSLPISCLNNLFRLGDNLIKLLGNSAYELLGMFESWCVGSILSNNPDQTTDAEEFRNNCSRELDEALVDLRADDVVRGLISDIIEVIDSLNNTERSNAFCLYRVWGHPTVNIHAGMEKVHKLGTKVKDIPPLLGTLMLCQFRKMFMCNFYKGHHEYPPNSGITSEYIRSRIKERLPIRTDHPAYNIRDFEYLQIEETYRVPDTYDLCHILNDKAVSPDLSELMDSIKRGRGTNCGAKRRGILRWMEGESINCKEFLSDISSNGLPPEECLIGMYEKEREIKVAARMYSLMTERMRYYFVLTEGLIADHLLPHFPEITMKDSLNVLIKKMWEAGGQRSRGRGDVNINIDFSKWNTNMRNDLTYKTFCEMDRVFGYKNLISRSHEIFEKSLIYSASGKYLPVVSNGQIKNDPPMCYRGHLGGFEGLRQKGWTIATVCLLAYLSEQQRVGMSLMGQGDNQIIRLRMPTSYWMAMKLNEEQQISESKKVLSKFVDSMDVLFSGAGLPIKVRETWKSSRLFMYGKVMLLDGKQLPQWYKKTLRSYALSNEGTLTVGGVIGTIATNMCAAASGSETPDLMYIFFLILAEWSLDWMFKYHPFTRKSIKEGRSLDFQMVEKRSKRYMMTQKVRTCWLKALLILIPTSVGGSITIPWTGFIMRGFPDKASEGYSWLKLLKSVDSPIKMFLENYYSFLCNDTIEPDMLIQSPFSLNHKRPPTPGLQSRENIREWLLSTPRFQQNRFIRGMKELLGSFPKKEICQELLTERMNPLITHEVFETFGQVYCEGIVSRVENTRTIRTLHLARSERQPIVKKLMDDESHHIAYIWWRAYQHGILFSECATMQARESRNKGWGRKIVGITTPHPLEVLFERTCSPTDDCKHTDDYLLSKAVDNGSFPPFLGSKIKTKVYSLQDEEARKEPLIRTGARLARQFNWIGMGQNLRDVVLNNVKTLCNIDIFDRFVDDDPSSNLYTGSVMHRFTPASVSEGCFINYAPQLGHRVFMSSDTLPSLSRGQTNFTFHFQAMYCFLQYFISKSELEGSYHNHIICNTCVIPVEDEFDDIKSSHVRIDHAQSERPAVIIKETLGCIIEKPKNTIVRADKSPIGIFIEDPVGRERMLLQGLSDLLSWKCATELLSRTNDTATSIGTEDLQSWPRIYAYKISRRIIIGKICTFIMYLIAVNMGESPHAHNLDVIRKRAIDSISSIRSDGFSSVASLCLGRDLPSPHDEIVVVEGASYPETVLSCLNSVKSSILLSLGRMVKLESFLTKGALYPVEGFVNREYFGILSSKSSILLKCSNLQHIWTENKDMEVELSRSDCLHKCTEKLLMRNKLIKMTLDRAFKYIPVQIVRHQPRPEINLICTISRSTKISGEIRTYSDTSEITVERQPFINDVRSYRTIQYPTSSCYKWTDVLVSQLSTPHTIVLGDGTGGTSLVAAELFSNSHIYPMALLEGKSLIPQDVESLSPPLSRKYENVYNKLLIDMPDDIFSESFAERLCLHVSRMEGKVRIISDVEGEAGKLNTMMDLVKKMPIGTEIILKSYLKDLLECFYTISCVENFRIIVSPLANMRYNEIFLQFTISSKNEKISRTFLKDWVCNHMEREAKEDLSVILKQIKDINLLFPYVTSTSINLALVKLSSWGGSFPMKVFNEHPMKLIGYVYQYLNTHYHFASSKYRPGDSRSITPKRKDQLTQMICSVLLVIFGEDTEVLREIESLILIGKRRGMEGRPHFKILIRQGLTRREITDDEVFVGRVLRNFRREKNYFELCKVPIGLPFEYGALKNINTFQSRIPVTLTSGWIEDHLQI